MKSNATTKNNPKMKSALRNALAFAAFAAAFALALELPSMIHARHCDGCEWFWCEGYNGK